MQFSLYHVHACVCVCVFFSFDSLGGHIGAIRITCMVVSMAYALICWVHVPTVCIVLNILATFAPGHQVTPL